MVHPPAPSESDEPASTVPSARIRAIAWGGAITALVAVIAVAAVLLFGLVTAEAVPAVTPTSADQREVVAAVQAFADAWREGDCAAYLKFTTQLEQDEAGITDCASFDALSAAFAETVGDMELFVTDISGPWYQYTVTTRERFLVERDPDGNQLSEPQHVTVEYSYGVVPHDDHWAILWWFDDGSCDAWSPVLTTPRGTTCESPDSD